MFRLLLHEALSEIDHFDSDPTDPARLEENIFRNDGMSSSKLVVHSILLSAICSLLPSCSFNSPPDLVRSTLKQQGVVVVEDQADRPKFRLMGTTAFNNRMDEISEPGFSFADFLVKELRAHGYKARKAESVSNEPSLSLFGTYPYGMPGMTGGGVFVRSFFGAGGSPQVHCNYLVSINQKSSDLHSMQPVHFGDSGYFSKAVDLEKEAGRWSDYSAEDKRQLREAMAEQMKKAADLVISDLGL